MSNRLDRLTPLDATFLNFEHPHAPMHVAGLYIFDGTPEIPGRPGLLGLFHTIEERLAEVPRYRQRVVQLPLRLAQPVWVDDPDFDLSYHLRRAALPRPGGMPELLDYVARLHSRPLDRRRPLWEVYIIEGLENGRMALYSKIHHAMVDGVSGIDLATILLDIDPGGRPPTATGAFLPAPLPGAGRLLTDLVRERVGAGLGTVVQALRHPQDVPAQVAGTVAETTMVRRMLGLLRRVPESPINAPVGASRRISLVPISLARAKAIKNALGGTVNDVLLAAYGEAIERFLDHRGVAHAEEVYRVMVPVSVRDESDRMALGNRVTAMFVDLPVGPMPAKRRLAAVSRAMRDLKEQRQAVAADRLIALVGLAPATLHGLAGRLEFTNQRVVNTVLSNVPGVQFPLYSGGSLLLEMYPLLPLTANVALVTCVTSYNGGLYFGLVGDYDVLPDLEVLADGLRRGFDRLEMAAATASRGPGSVGGTPAETLTVVPAARRRARRHPATTRALEVVGTVEEPPSRRTSRRRAPGG